MTTQFITPEERLAENRGVQHHDFDAHSPFGGSVATRVLRCPASVRLVEKVPAHLRKSSAYADRGTALHAAMALLIENECSLAGIAGKKIDSYVITLDDVENALRPVLTYVEALLDHPGAEYFLERRVFFPTIPGAFGTCDLIVRIGSAVHVIDFKFGTGVRVLALYADRRRGRRQRAAHVLRRGRAPLDARIFCRRRQYRSDHPATDVDRARRRNGVVGRDNPRRAR